MHTSSRSLKFLRIVPADAVAVGGYAAAGPDALVETIQTNVANGIPVSLVGFGTFKSAKREARVGMNPKTGEALAIPVATVPKFSAGTTFKAIVDSKADAGKAKVATN